MRRKEPPADASPSTLADAFARCTAVPRDTHDDDDDPLAVVRALSVPRDFPELGNCTNETLRNMLADATGAAFETFYASTSVSVDLDEVKTELKREIERAREANDRLESETRDARAIRAALEATDLRNAESSYEEVRRTYLRKTRDVVSDVSSAIDAAGIKARELERESDLTLGDFVRRSGDSRANGGFVDEYLNLRRRAHLLKTYVAIAADSK
jgi:FtsZ-binding cell division protein ZapB